MSQQLTYTALAISYITGDTVISTASESKYVTYKTDKTDKIQFMDIDEIEACIENHRTTFKIHIENETILSKQN